MHASSIVASELKTTNVSPPLDMKTTEVLVEILISAARVNLSMSSITVKTNVHGLAANAYHADAVPKKNSPAHPFHLQTVPNASLSELSHF